MSDTWQKTEYKPLSALPLTRPQQIRVIALNHALRETYFEHGAPTETDLVGVRLLAEEFEDWITNGFFKDPQ